MKRGAVVHFSDYKFLDGGHADKLCVIISECTGDEIVMLIATSKGKDTSSHGCQPIRKKYFIKKGKYGFDKDTWIDLARNIRPYPKGKLQDDIASGAAKIITHLPDSELNALSNCLKKHARESLSRECCKILGVNPNW